MPVIPTFAQITYKVSSNTELYEALFQKQNNHTNKKEKKQRKGRETPNSLSGGANVLDNETAFLWDKGLLQATI